MHQMETEKQNILVKLQVITSNVNTCTELREKKNDYKMLKENKVKELKKNLCWSLYRQASHAGLKGENQQRAVQRRD